MRRRTRRSNREGTALFLSLVLITVVMIMSAGVVQLSSVSSRMQQRSLDQLKAFYLAEAGLAEAFEGVRMGRSGAIASEEEPARFGDGTVWVTSVQTGDRRIWLEASAVAGLGRATLGLVLNPPQQSLGFFADEDVVIESVVLVDGFDSGLRPYAAEVAIVQEKRMIDTLLDPAGVPPVPVTPDLSNPYHPQQLELIELIDALPSGYSPATVVGQLLLRDLGSGADPRSAGQPPLPRVVQAAVDATINDLPRFRLAFLAGALFPLTASGEASPVTPEPPGEVTEPGKPKKPKERGGQNLSEAAGVLGAEPGGGSDPRSVTAGGSQQSTGGAGALAQRLGTHTDHGGLIGSNGSITFQSDDAAKVLGNVIPGIGGRLQLSALLEVSGSTRPRDLAVDLAEVQFPDVPELSGIDHGGAVPLLVSAEDAEYPLIQVRAGAEVVLRGPARVLVDDLRVDAGGHLVFDTRDGPLEVYIANGMQLAAGSSVETTADTSKEVTLFGLNNGSRGNGAPLDLSGAGAFHGTIYAPDSDVLIGGDFEIFGGVVAGRLEIKAGARLHFDDPGYSNQIKLPRQETWRILELPDRGGAVARIVPPGAPPLSAAHRLDNVNISVDYTDDVGAAQTYVGPESAMDWSRVAMVRTVERDADFSSLEDAQERLLREAWAREVKREAGATVAPANVGSGAPKPLSAGESIDTVEARVATERFLDATTDERTERVVEAVTRILEVHGDGDGEYRVFGSFILEFEKRPGKTEFELYTNDWNIVGDGEVKNSGRIQVKNMR